MRERPPYPAVEWAPGSVTLSIQGGGEPARRVTLDAETADRLAESLATARREAYGPPLKP